MFTFSQVKLLCFDIPIFLWVFTSLWCQRMFQAHLVFSLPQPWKNRQLLLEALDSFSEGWYLETKVKLLGILSATGMSLLLGPLLSKRFKFISILSIPVQYYKIHSSLLFLYLQPYSPVVRNLHPIIFNILTQV